MDLEIELLKIKTSIEITLLKIELFFVKVQLFIHDNLKYSAQVEGEKHLKEF